MNTPNRKQQARRVFLTLVDLTESAQHIALEQACGDDAALRAEVEELLLADREAKGFLSLPSGLQPVSDSVEQPGSQIGHYKLLEQIGEGGMGTVWMAEQKEPVKRRVALKIIKLGMDTKQVVARFEAERQALAMMDHPHIAKVLDAGSTDTGRPYFVMEYIKGIPILEYCDHEKVDTKTRLELFTSVCHAIQHAHQKGIIHRDIKPTNVLVTMHDGVPVTKVIDFGIAKATNSELTTKTLFTEHRQMVGTPAYMSPEQAELSGLDIDTRSDIYSLGVLLYELLTGTTPFDIKDLMAKGFAEMMRTIREVEPHKPSTRISTLGETGTRTALQRKVDAKKLGSLLRGDLDWIVMKCLEKDRSRRYETANGLAADIKRHLNDEPVTAGAPSAGYRLRKFAKRNKVQVLAGGAVAAALLIGVVAFAWQAKIADEQRIDAEEARLSETEQRKLADASKTEAEAQAKIAKAQGAEAKKSAVEARAQEAEAKKQAAIAEAIAKFQTEMLAAADPQKLLGDKVTVVQVMDAAVKLLDTGSLKDQPLVEADVRATIGLTLMGLGRFADAEPNLRKSLAILRASLPAGHPDIAAGLNNLGEFLRTQNELAEAEPLYREALEILRASLPAGHPDIAKGLNNLAVLLQAQNKLAEAEPLFREALQIRRASLPAGHPDIATGLNNLAALLQSQNKLAEAEPLFREALQIRRASLPAGHPDISTGLNELAVLLHTQNKLAEAEPLFREALEICRASLPAGHPDIAAPLHNLASLLQAQNQLAEAEPLFREALQIRRASLPAGHPDIAAGLNNLAMLLQVQNKLAEAEPLYRELLEIRRRQHAGDHADIAFCLANLGRCLHDQNRTADAEHPLREAVAMWDRLHTGDDANVAPTLNRLASVRKSLGRLREAEPLYVQSAAMYARLYPGDHRDVAQSRFNLAIALEDLGRTQDAEPLFVQSLEMRQRL
ncbi:MAG: tetratricopeptide repeat protein, partial [Planctomycetota bacterium]